MKQRYQTGKIYQIVNDVNDQVYIGSTSAAMAHRHRARACRRPLPGDLAYW